MSSSRNETGSAADPRIAVVTLGMHRSGTSALSGVLARLGCDMPATPMASDDRNTKGFYESRPISNLNNLVLASAGTSWDDWNAVAPAWFDSPRRSVFAEQALELVKSEFGDSPLIVLKDPRLSILAPLWFDVLARAGYATRVVFSYRAAAAVAASLAERNAFDPALGQLVWLRYMLEGERASRDVPRVFVGYDRLLADWQAEVKRIEAKLDLSLPRQSPRAIEEVDTFLTPSMRHHASDTSPGRTDAAAHRWIADAQAVFERWLQDGEDPEGKETLERIRAEVNAATPAFDRLVRTAKDRPKAEAALRQQLEEAKADRTAAETRADRIAAEALGDQAAFRQAEARIAALEADLETRTSKVTDLKNELDSQQEELGRRAEMLLTFEKEVEDSNTALADLSRLQVNLQEEFQAAREAAEQQKGRSEAALAHANAEIERIMNSRSVRMMAPLRRLRSLLGGV